MIWRFMVEHIVEMGSLGDFRFGTLGEVTDMLGVTDSLSVSDVVSDPTSGTKEFSARESSSCCLKSLSFGRLLKLIFGLLLDEEDEVIIIISSSSSVTPLPPPEVLADRVLPGGMSWSPILLLITSSPPGYSPLMLKLKDLKNKVRPFQLT